MSTQCKWWRLKSGGTAQHRGNFPDRMFEWPLYIVAAPFTEPKTRIYPSGVRWQLKGWETKLGPAKLKRHHRQQTASVAGSSSSSYNNNNNHCKCACSWGKSVGRIHMSACVCVCVYHHHHSGDAPPHSNCMHHTHTLSHPSQNRTHSHTHRCLWQKMDSI